MSIPLTTQRLQKLAKAVSRNSTQDEKEDDDRHFGASSLWKRPKDTLVGYTGYDIAPQERHGLEEETKKYVIRGYSGFLPKTRTICGKPSIPSEDDQEILYNKKGLKREERVREPNLEDNKEMGSLDSMYRVFGKGMDIHERYALVVSRLKDTGLTQEMLLKTVQGKLSGRIGSNREQILRLRTFFQDFDKNLDGVLDEYELREGLERMNIQLDDVQSLSLFALFDKEHKGYIDWHEFIREAMVPNPRGGSNVQPKQIIATSKTA